MREKNVSGRLEDCGWLCESHSFQSPGGIEVFESILEGDGVLGGGRYLLHDLLFFPGQKIKVSSMDFPRRILRGA